jgi:DNA-directed RNA polymerase subunit RPC12/RpoP
MSEYHCHSCGAEVNQVVVDLGLSPFSNAFITDQGQKNTENKYPLVALVCPECRLVQLSPTSLGNDHFHEDYVYFSSFSESWLQHAKNYQEMITERFSLNNKSSKYISF